MTRSPAMDWWLENTAAGRRILARVMPNSALPVNVRRAICRDRGHDFYAGICTRCGEREENGRGRG